MYSRDIRGHINRGGYISDYVWSDMRGHINGGGYISSDIRGYVMDTHTRSDIRGN